MSFYLVESSFEISSLSLSWPTFPSLNKKVYKEPLWSENNVFVWYFLSFPLSRRPEFRSHRKWPTQCHTFLCLLNFLVRTLFLFSMIVKNKIEVTCVPADSLRWPTWVCWPVTTFLSFKFKLFNTKWSFHVPSGVACSSLVSPGCFWYSFSKEIIFFKI